MPFPEIRSDADFHCDISNLKSDTYNPKSHLSQSSNSTPLAVFSSRYFTITGV
jgi:hypothetical protein